MKRMLSAVLAAILLLSLMPFSALAAENGVIASGSCGSSLTWTLTEDGTLTISGSGVVTDYSGVSGTPWYSYLDRITCVALESGITALGKNAFCGCPNLTTLKIGAIVTRIEWSSFFGCGKLAAFDVDPANTRYRSEGGIMYQIGSLNSISVDYVPEGFRGRLVIPEGLGKNGAGLDTHVDTISPYALRNCTKLTKVVIPESVSGIGQGAFFGCTGLTEITIPKHVCTIFKSTFEGCTGLQRVMIENDTRNKDIREYAFKGCSSLKEITLPDTLNFINEGAFSGCTSLEEIVLPDKLHTLGKNVFRDCVSLKSIKFSQSLKKLDDNAFSGCASLTSITIPDNIQSLGSGVFFNCTGLMSVAFPEAFDSIGSGAFEGCTGLISIQFPQLLNTIGSSAFSRCTGLVSLEIPETVPAIEAYCFSDCTALAEVHLPHSLERIGAAAFQNCPALTDLYIGLSLADIGESAFGGCCRLTNVYYSGTDEEFAQITIGADNDALLNAPNLVTEYMVRDRLVKTLSKDGVLTISGTGPMLNYDELDAVGPEYASPWAANDEVKAVVIMPGVTSIGDRAFEYCQNLRSVTIPETVTSIGYSAFLNCPALTELNLQEGLAVIKDAAFAGCRALKSVQLPDSLEVIGDGAFGMCEGLRDLRLGSGIAALRSHAFWGCSSLTSVTIPESVTSIGAAPFGSCANLKSIQTASDQAFYTSVDGVLFSKDLQRLICCPAGKSGDYTAPDGVAVVGPQAFNGCSRLQYVKLQESCTVVADGAFGDCTGLKSVALPASVTTYDSAAFYGCTALKDIYYAGTRPEWNEVTILGERSAIDQAKIHYGMTDKAVNPFRDVPAEQYYTEPVMWAVGHTPQITNGMSADSFAPESTCTRGQVVTFLWRAKGCPKANGRTNPFRAVSPGDYYYEAVLWANETGVTQGTSSTTFSPGNPCTRAQVVTFLWRSQGSAAPTSSNPFRDVPGGEYYTSAVLWAVDQGITAGTGPAAFSPNNSCTRAQIVTFLYRFVTRDTVTVPPPPPEPDPEPEPEAPIFTEAQGRSYCSNAFRSIKRDYPAAKAIMGTYSYYTDKDGHLAVYVEIDYKIIRKFQDTFLFVDGRRISDPVNYYKEQASHAFGANKLHLMDLWIDVLKAQACTFPSGVVSGDYLNQFS